MRPLAVYLLLLICAALPLKMHAQKAPDPLSGIWTGEWGPSPKDRNLVTVELKWDGKTVTGAVEGKGNVAGPNSPVRNYTISFTKTSFDPKTGVVRLEADAWARGYPVHYVINGTLQSDLMTGTWKHGDKKGNFRLSKN